VTAQNNTLGRILAVSPHLDDGVFSCGGLLARHPGGVVATVFAGVPSAENELTPWDAACGFASAREAVDVRRVEDSAALGMLCAQPCWFDFTDSQYRDTQDIGDIALALERAIRQHCPDTIIIPFGLFHSDHALAHDAALRVFQHDAAHAWFAYEDALYRAFPGLLQQRLCKLADAHVRATPAIVADADVDTKRRAVECYQSQLRGLATPGRPGGRDLIVSERYWRLGMH
jgi:LmbE family N-acetylglucosaminyl deacetylase